MGQLLAGALHQLNSLEAVGGAVSDGRWHSSTSFPVQEGRLNYCRFLNSLHKGLVKQNELQHVKRESFQES